MATALRVFYTLRCGHGTTGFSHFQAPDGHGTMDFSHFQIPDGHGTMGFHTFRCHEPARSVMGGTPRRAKTRPFRRSNEPLGAGFGALPDGNGTTGLSHFHVPDGHGTTVF